MGEVLESEDFKYCFNCGRMKYTPKWKCPRCGEDLQSATKHWK